MSAEREGVAAATGQRRLSGARSDVGARILDARALGSAVGGAR